MKITFKFVALFLMLCIFLTSCANPVPLAQTSQQNSSAQQQQASENSQATSQVASAPSEVSSSSVSQEEPSMAYAATLADILARGTLIVGVDENFYPLSYKDDSGNFAGLDIDLANEICTILGVTPEFVAVPWAQKEQMLNTGEVDCLMSGLAITQNRAQIMNFTRAYLSNMLVIYTKPEISVSSVSDLAGLSIGVQEGRTAIEVAQSSYIYDSIKNDIIEYPAYTMAFEDMEKNILDCVIVPDVYKAMGESDLRELYSTAMLDFGDAPVAIGTRKTDPELSTAIDDALASLMQDGTVEALNMTHYNMDIYVVRQ